MTTLANGVPTSSSVSAGSWAYYDLTLASTSVHLLIRLTTTNNTDLYLRQGAEPTLVDYDARSQRSGTSVEVIWLAEGDDAFVPGATYTVGLYGAGSGSHSFEVLATWSDAVYLPQDHWITQTGQTLIHDDSWGRWISDARTVALPIDPAHHPAHPTVMSSQGYRLVLFSIIRDADEVFQSAGFYHSDNGSLWVLDHSVGEGVEIHCITHVEGAFYAGGRAFVNSVPHSILYRSENGHDWQLVADINYGDGASPAFGKVVYGNNTFAITPHGEVAASTHFATSTDGIAWTQRLLSVPLANLAFGRGYFVGATVTNGLYQTENLITWINTGAGLYSRWVAFGFQGYFIAITTTGEVHLSVTGETWFNATIGDYDFANTTLLQEFYDRLLVGNDTFRLASITDTQVVSQTLTVTHKLISAASRPLDWNPYASWSPTTAHRITHATGYGISSLTGVRKTHASGYYSRIHRIHASGYQSTTTIRVTRCCGWRSGWVRLTQASGWRAMNQYRHVSGWQSATITRCAHSASWQSRVTVRVLHSLNWQSATVLRLDHVSGYQSAIHCRSPHASGWRSTIQARILHAGGWRSNATIRKSHDSGWQSSANVVCRHAAGWLAGTGLRSVHRSGYGPFQPRVIHASRYRVGDAPTVRQTGSVILWMGV